MRGTDKRAIVSSVITEAVIYYTIGRGGLIGRQLRDRVA